jgi:hypothetical protein
LSFPVLQCPSNERVNGPEDKRLTASTGFSTVPLGQTQYLLRFPTRGNLKHSLFGLSQPKSNYFTPPWGPEIFACGNLNSINEHMSRGHRFTRLRPRICRPSGALTRGCSSHQRTVASAHRKSSYARVGHHVLSQLFDWQRFIYHIF